MPAIFNVTINGTKVEVGCYGGGSDWVCRLSYANEDRGPVSDGYYPPPVIGVLWVREQHGRWFASGMVNREVYHEAAEIHGLIDRIMSEVVGLNAQTADCVELVEPRFVSIFSGEEGYLFFEGGGLGARFDSPK